MVNLFTCGEVFMICIGLVDATTTPSFLVLLISRMFFTFMVLAYVGYPRKWAIILVVVLLLLLLLLLL